MARLTISQVNRVTDIYLWQQAKKTARLLVEASKPDLHIKAGETVDIIEYCATHGLPVDIIKPYIGYISHSKDGQIYIGK